MTTNLPDRDEYIGELNEKGYNLIAPDDPGPSDDELRPLSFSDAIEYHIEYIRNIEDAARTTVSGHQTKLRNFCSWALYIAEVEDTGGLEPHHFEGFKKHRAENVQKTTLKDDMNIVGKWIRILGRRNAVPTNLHTRVVPPSVTAEQETRHEYLEDDIGDAILDHVRKYEYGSLDHISYELWWAAGVRLGAIHGLDEGDFDPEESCLRLRHRPGGEIDTPLKNGESSERSVGLAPTTTKAIQDYLDSPDRYEHVEETADGEQRRPLLTTQNGRVSRSHLREIAYRLTQPCTRGEPCPLDRDPEECQAHNQLTHGSKCPDSKSPHPIRSGTLTRQLKRGVDPADVSSRADVGLETLEQHYNEMSEDERMAMRREQFDEEFDRSASDEEVRDRLFH